MTSMEKVQKQLLEMESYSAKATLIRVSNKGEMTYETLQHNTIDGKYRLEITSPTSMNGNYTVSDGENVYQYNAKTKETVAIDLPDGQKGDELFLCTFVKNYFNSEDVAVDTVASLEGSECTMLEAVVTGGNKYIASERLWIDNETLLPVKYAIYDEDDNERYIIIYNEFEYNPNVDGSLFTVG